MLIHKCVRKDPALYAYIHVPNLFEDDLKKCPMIVFLHGGPHDRASPFFHPKRAFWFNKGFVVVDINYRGSTGYGRCFRDLLWGGWGDLDAQDSIDVVENLLSNGLGSRQKVFISGGSAGAFSILHVLNRAPELFTAAALYYGVTELKALVLESPKLERFYIQQLVGVAPETSAHDPVWEKFIPRMEKIVTPMVLFHGRKDPIVPCSASEIFFQKLQEKKIPSQLYLYENEGHGFRILDNQVDAIEKEHLFFQSQSGI